MLHRTLTDNEGNTYKLVSSRWLKALTAVAGINFIVLMVIVAVVIDNMRHIEQTVTFTEKVSQRNKAVGDVTGNRVKANIWAFNEACDYAKKNGRDCMQNPKWYADPLQYPLIVNDVMGEGLFPPKEEK